MDVNWICEQCSEDICEECNANHDRTHSVTPWHKIYYLRRCFVCKNIFNVVNIWYCQGYDFCLCSTCKATYFAKKKQLCSLENRQCRAQNEIYPAGPYFIGRRVIVPPLHENVRFKAHAALRNKTDETRHGLSSVCLRVNTDRAIYREDILKCNIHYNEDCIFVCADCEAAGCAFCRIFHTECTQMIIHRLMVD